MRAILAAAVLTLVACGGNTGGDDGDDTNTKPDACVGLECAVVNCGSMQKQPTTLTGTVFAPNGTLPLFGVNVYVPRDPPGPFPEGAQCSRCSDPLLGSPITRTQTDDKGNFTLENVPVGDNIPLVITSGKWRRQIVIPKVDQCVTAPVPTVATRFPKNKSEGDIPKIALTTGSADSLECLVRKLGIDDAEITNETGGGRVNYFVGATGTPRVGVSSLVGGATLTDAQTLWNDPAKLKGYDIVFLSCEGDQIPAQKSQTAMNNVKGYADLGGRLFASHWHNVWIGGEFQSNGNDKPPIWETIGTWNNGGDINGTIFIDEVSNGKGPSFANWMVNVGGSTVRGEIDLVGGTGKVTAQTVDTTKAERWVNRTRQGGNPQMFQFTTPNEVGADQRCGKVVFSDMHVSGTSAVGMPFPNSCPNGGAGNLTLSPQEKALAFMFFDIASCVGQIF